MTDLSPGTAVPGHLLRAVGVRVDARPLPLLEPTTVSVASGQRLLVAGEPGHGHTALALALGGRLAVDAGHVELDGSRSGRALRRAVALVDVPGVSEPDPVLPLRTVVAEELAMAGLPTRHGAVQAFLDERGYGDLAGRTLEAVPPGPRLRILAGIAARRPGVIAVVTTVPDRFGGDPADWWGLAGELAATGLAVVVSCTDASALQVTGAPSSHPWRDPAPVALGSAALPSPDAAGVTPLAVPEESLP
ncbi:MAG TPA: ABC transporter ATP-binding protein [Kineosporiaceae bacterium]|nr:ABC transporter ATP-binding protein [Kineosporiaceae bacterium]